MKPIITYNAPAKLPFGIESPIVRKRESKKSMRNFNDKQEFVAFIESIKPSRRVDHYIVISCSCGKEYEFKNKDEIPSSNLVCGCERELIIYGN